MMNKKNFIKFINIDQKLYKILKHLKKKDLNKDTVYIKSLDRFVKKCRKILDGKNATENH